MDMNQELYLKNSTWKKVVYFILYVLSVILTLSMFLVNQKGGGFFILLKFSGIFLMAINYIFYHLAFKMTKKERIRGLSLIIFAVFIMALMPFLDVMSLRPEGGALYLSIIVMNIFFIILILLYIFSTIILLKLMEDKGYDDEGRPYYKNRTLLKILVIILLVGIIPYPKVSGIGENNYIKYQALLYSVKSYYYFDEDPNLPADKRLVDKKELKLFPMNIVDYLKGN